MPMSRRFFILSLLLASLAVAALSSGCAITLRDDADDSPYSTEEQALPGSSDVDHPAKGIDSPSGI